MQYILQAPQTIDTTVKLPPSKSISNRALIIHALSGANRMPLNLSDCDDTSVILHTLANMPSHIDIKAAGTAMRFLTAYLAVTEGEHTITGTERMQQRPIGTLVDALRYMGADITYLGNEGYPPLRIRGRHLEGGHIEVPGNISSQYISALLMIGPALTNGLELKLIGDIASKPYIDLTLCMMKEFGAEAEWNDIDSILVKPTPYKDIPYTIESDWSAASYWYEMMVLADKDARIRLQGLADGSRQGDSVVRYLFSLLGIKTAFEPAKGELPAHILLTRHEGAVQRLDYDFINSPDLAQTFVVCCALLEMPFHFTGLGSLRIKETDRIEALCTELRKLGYVLQVRNGSELLWEGEHCTPTFEPINTYEDHRMAMAFAPAAFKFGNLAINNPQVVSKSYPNFWHDLAKAGFTLNEE
ncbi:MAG TPA: 3-phosphoshikimate 1-carboxyvinyltransferase [Prevotella sp.]